MRRWYFGILMLLTPASANAQTIAGSLVDDGTLQGVPGAIISLINQQGRVARNTVTDSLGRFFFDVAFGTYQLEASRVGYHQTRSEQFYTEAIDTLKVEFRISSEVVLLNPIVVDVGMRPGREIFEERMATEAGFFFTPQMVDSLRPSTHPGEILAHADDTRVRWSWGIFENGQTGPIPYVSTYVGVGCVNFVVDGSPVPQPFFTTSDHRGRLVLTARWGVAPLSELTPDDLVAIEVYRAWHEVPERFREDLRIRNRLERETFQIINQKGCGIVFIWTEKGWN